MRKPIWKLGVPTALTVVAAALVAPLLTTPATAAPVEVRLTSSTPTFYPPDDDYRDVARFSIRINRSADVTLQVRRSKGTPAVRLIDLGDLGKGKHTGTWDGKDNVGDLVDTGRYVVRALARRPGDPVQRSRYVAVRMQWKQLATQSSTSHLTANSYHKVTGECGHLDQLSGNRVRFDMDEPADCSKGFSGGIDAHYRFAQYPEGFSDRGRVIHPHVTVRANGNHPVGYGTLGLETWLDLRPEEGSGWEWYYDSSSGDDGIVEMNTELSHHQPTERPVRFTFGGSTGDDYVLDGFVVDLTWKTLVPAPPA
jgi:hypothetical protein